MSCSGVSLPFGLSVEFRVLISYSGSPSPPFFMRISNHLIEGYKPWSKHDGCWISEWNPWISLHWSRCLHQYWVILVRPKSRWSASMHLQHHLPPFYIFTIGCDMIKSNQEILLVECHNVAAPSLHGELQWDDCLVLVPLECSAASALLVTLSNFLLAGWPENIFFAFLTRVSKQLLFRCFDWRITFQQASGFLYMYRMQISTKILNSQIV